MNSNAHTQAHAVDFGTPNLVSGEWNEGLANEIRPDERRGLAGGFLHGVTVLRGGAPRKTLAPAALPISSNNVVVLQEFADAHMQPDMSYEQCYKVGTEHHERVSARSFPPSHGMLRRTQDQPIGQMGEPGTVLYTFDNLKPDLSGEALTNDVGGRPAERRGTRGGFKRGRTVWSGGLARISSARAPEIVNSGTVLFVSEDASMLPDVSQLPGTDEYERRSRQGSFEHGDLHVSFKPWDAESWEELGQVKGYRRCAPGHYASGSSVLGGVHLGPKEYSPDFQIFRSMPLAAAAM